MNNTSDPVLSCGLEQGRAIWGLLIPKLQYFQPGPQPVRLGGKQADGLWIPLENCSLLLFNVLLTSQTSFITLLPYSPFYLPFSLSLLHLSKIAFAFQFSSAQSLTHVWLFAIPWTEACQAPLSITNCQSLLKLMFIKAVMSSNHLILCRPLLLLTFFNLS